MSLLEHMVATPFAQALGWTLLHSLWQGTAISAVLGAVLMSTRSARVRYGVACFAMLAVVMCACFTLVHVMPTDRNARTTINASATASIFRSADADLNPSHPRLTAAVPWLALFWIAGVWILALRQMMGWIAALRLRWRGVFMVPVRWQQEVASLAARLAVTKAVFLLESCIAEVPVVIGHLRPVILIPIGVLVGLPGDQVESILLHELAHIRRCDYLVNVLQRAVECLLFYHPMVWWMSHVTRTERENCCDDIVTSLCDAHEYAVALAALEQNRWSNCQPSVAATGGSLMKRIRRLLYPTAGRAVWSPFLALAIIIGSATVAFAVWPVQSKDQAETALPSGQAAEQLVHVDKVHFVGLTQLDADPLNDCSENVRTHTYSGPKWQLTVAERARFCWQRYGYFKVQITDPEFQRLPDRDGLPDYAVTLTVNQGAQYRLSNISFRNNQAFSSSELRQMFPIADGDVFDKEYIAQGLNAMRDAYGSRGYSNMWCVPGDEANEANHTVALVITIQEDAKESTVRTNGPVTRSNLGEQESGAAQQSQARAMAYQNWLNQDVAYIISSQERSDFQSLSTDEARDEFIQRFWERHNPNPGMPASVFKQEHYQRLAYANRHFASDRLPGWKSDRGMIYIEFGRPDEVDVQPDAIPPSETWIYRTGRSEPKVFTFVDRVGKGLTLYSGPGSEAGVRISEPVAMSNLIHHVDPVYPELAKTARIEGNTVYQIVVGKDGAVIDIHAISGPPMLYQSGIDAIRQWQFKPLLLSGQPVKFSTEVTIPFTSWDSH